MDDTRKILEALIDALGFEVEEAKDYSEMKVDKKKFRAMMGDRIICHPGCERRCISDNQGAYIIDSEGMYTSVLIHPLIGYKVVPKAGKELKSLKRMARYEVIQWCIDTKSPFNGNEAPPAGWKWVRNSSHSLRYHLQSTCSLDDLISGQTVERALSSAIAP